MKLILSGNPSVVIGAEETVALGDCVKYCIQLFWNELLEEWNIQILRRVGKGSFLSVNHNEWKSAQDFHAAMTEFAVICKRYQNLIDQWEAAEDLVANPLDMGAKDAAKARREKREMIA